MHYDDLYEYIGHMGRFQWISISAIFVHTVFSVELYSMIFVGGQMDHWCSVDELSGLTPEQQRYIAIPMTSSPSDDVIVYSSCEMFDVNWTAYSIDELMNWNRTEWMDEMNQRNSTLLVRQCSKWNYDRSMFKSTIVSRFDLVCGSDFLNELVTILIMVGSVIGTLTSGAFSDRFGRKRPLIAYLFIKLIGSAIAIFAENYVTFVIGRFVNYTGSCGAGMITFVIVMEMVGPKYRTVVGVLSQVSYSIGFIIAPVAAYFIRDEFYLQIAIMSPPIVFIPYAFSMPESPRWLIVKGRLKEALEVLNKMCKTNNSTLPDDLDLTSLEEETDLEEKGCAALIHSPAMRMRTALVSFGWFTSSLVYFAFSMFSNYDEMSESLYLSTFLSAAVEIPVFVFAIFLVDLKWLGRRGTISYSLMGAGVASFACAVMITYDFQIALMVFTIIGKTLISLAYTVVYLYGSEVFPTEVRTTGLAIASACECVGVMVAPLIGGPLRRTWLYLPSIIYGLLSCLSGLSHFYLPETLGNPLPDTVDQADQLAAAQRNKRKRRLTVNGNAEFCRRDTKNSSENVSISL